MMTKQVKHFAAALTLVGCIVAPAASHAGTKSTPHGTVGSSCSISQQQTEATELANALSPLVTALPAVPGGNYSSQGTRDLMYGSLAGILLGNSNGASNANFWVKQVFQKLSSTNDVPQDAGDTSTNDDTNYTEFAFLPLGVMMAQGNVTIATLLDNSKPGISGVSNSTIVHNIIIALETEANHTGSLAIFDDTYTNVWLMNTTGRILMDQALLNYTGNPGNLYGYNAGADLKLAETQLSGWLTEVKTNGIHEFDSPTYTGTQLESLLLGYHYVTEDTNKLKENYKTGLDYVWLDLGVNFFANGLKIGPPYSRNYDIISASGTASTSSGLLLPWIEVMGCWTTGDVGTGTQLLTNGPKVVLEHVALYDSVVGAWNGYQLENATYDLGATQGANNTTDAREVYQNWHSSKSGARRVERIGADVAMGCASAAYSTHDQDTMVGGMLAGHGVDSYLDQNQGIYSLVLDSSGLPYGNPTIGGKPWHLQENAACGMGGTASLVSFSFDATLREPSTEGGDNGLYTNIIFPYDPTTGLTGSSTLPVVKINNITLTGTCSTCVTTASNHTYVCPLVMGTSVVTFNRPSGAGVLGFKLLESTWTSPTLSHSDPTLYQLEIDQDLSAANPTGGPASRIVITHSRSATQAGDSQQAHVAMVMLMDDTTGSPTNVYNILHGATFSESGAGTSSLTQIVNFPTLKPTDEHGNSLDGLKIVRPDTDAADDVQIGTYSKEVGGSWSTIGVSSENLHVLDGTGAAVNGSNAFWTESAHTINLPQ